MTGALHILGAAIAGMIISIIWYHPRVFGAYWREVIGVTDKQDALAQKRMPISLLVSLVGYIVLAFVMQSFGEAWGAVTWWDALGLAFWSWLGFIAATSLGTILWEQKPVRFYLVNVGCWLVSFIAIVLILTL